GPRPAPSAPQGAHLSVAADLANDELLTARHRKSFGHAAQHHFPMGVAIGAHPPLEAAYCLARDQTIPVHAHEARAEFLFEAGERLLEEKLPIGGTYRYISEPPFEVDYFVDGDEHHPP